MKSTIEKISQNFIARNYFGIPLNPRLANKHLRQDNEFRSVIGVCATERGINSLSALRIRNRVEPFPLCSLQSRRERQLCGGWLIRLMVNAATTDDNRGGDRRLIGIGRAHENW